MTGKPLLKDVDWDAYDTYKACLHFHTTASDRELWDELLQVVIPQGRNIWVFADDDAEKPSHIGHAFELFPLAENTEENVKQAMISGAFFSASKNQQNTSGQNQIFGDGLVPIVTKLVVDGNKITVECDPERGCDRIEWIADGKVIASDDSGSCNYTIDLSDYTDQLGTYIRFELKSEEHGVTYSQAFELKYEGRVEKEIPESPVFNHFTGRLKWKLRQNIFSALADFIREKVGLKRGTIPKVAAY